MPDESDIGSSPNTTQFKTKNKSNDSNIKGFEKKSDHYS